MHATTTTNPTPAAPAPDRRPVHCPDCGRYLAALVAHDGPPAGRFWVRLNCRSCGVWAWFDLATGERRDAHLTNPVQP
jgi:hypothetical protein